MNIIYKIVTDRIIACLKAGEVPWQKPLPAKKSACNFISKHEYTGINRVITNMGGWSIPYFVTASQIMHLGGRIQKGAKSTPILYFNVKEKEKADGTIDHQTILKYSNVFNLSQTTLDLPIEPVVSNELTPTDIADNIINACGVDTKLQVYYKQNDLSSYYHILFNQIAFKEIYDPSPEDTMQDYTVDHLTVELTTSFIMREISLGAIEQKADHVASWLSVLEKDPAMIITAAKAAEAASKKILSKNILPLDYNIFGANKGA